MNGKRIALVTPYGAAPRYDNYAEFMLAEELVTLGNTVRLYTYAVRDIPALQKDVVHRGVPAIRCRQRYGIAPKLFMSILRFRPDIVICFHPKNFLNFTAYCAARIVGARFIVEVVGILHDRAIVRDVDNPDETIRQSPHLVTNLAKAMSALRVMGVRKTWENYVLHMPTAHADTIIAINEQERELIARFYGRAAERIYYATPRNLPQTMKRPAGASHLPDGFLFFIGQIKRRKGWHTAIDAIAALNARGREAHLAFATPDDLSIPTEYAREKGVLGKITFFKSVSNEERQWLYAHAAYVLVPSTYEGFGLPVFEAFLAGKPVCVSDTPVFRELLVHAEDAMLFKTGDADALAHVIEELDADGALREKLITEGRRTAARFSCERMVKEHLAVFSKALSRAT